MNQLWMTTSEDRMNIDGGVDAYFFRANKSDCNGYVFPRD